MEKNMPTTGMGWVPDLPYHRDYSQDHVEIEPIVEDLGIADEDAVTVPISVDLRQWCSQIESQGSLLIRSSGGYRLGR